MIVIVDYKMGNLGSVSNIIKKIGHTSIISSDIATIANASKIILPGVGSFEKAMENYAIEFAKIDEEEDRLLLESGILNSFKLNSFYTF